MRRNLDQILEIHEEMLGNLHKVVPHAEYNQGHAGDFSKSVRPRHIRFHSLDVLQTRREDASCRKQRYSLDNCQIADRAPVGLLADPQTAARVAAVFNQFVSLQFPL
jgi:hypothetical protein